jgi:hypothetical protein
MKNQMVHLFNACTNTDEYISQPMEQVQYLFDEKQEEFKERLENLENIVASLPEHLQNQLLLSIVSKSSST